MPIAVFPVWWHVFSNLIIMFVMLDTIWLNFLFVQKENEAINEMKLNFLIVQKVIEAINEMMSLLFMQMIIEAIDEIMQGT